MKTLPPENVVRFVLASRTTPHRTDFDAYIEKMLDDALEQALYAPTADARTLYAGRAQVLREINLLLQTRNTGRK